MTTDPTTDELSEIEMQQYLAWARSWAAATEMSPLGAAELEQRVRAFFHRLCDRVRASVALEIGAHEASFSRWAVAELPGVRSLAYEADPYVHDKFCKRLERAGVDYRNVAVAPTSGEVELHLPVELGNRSRPRASRMASLVHHEREVESMTVTVPAIRLDEEESLAGDGRIVAWIDVEGANEAVLSSGPKVLRRVDVLYLEVEDGITWEGQCAELAADPQVAREVARLQRFRKQPAQQSEAAT